MKEFFDSITTDIAADFILSQACKWIGESETDIFKLLSACVINLEIANMEGDMQPAKMFEISEVIMKKLKTIVGGDGYLTLEKQNECNDCIYKSSTKEEC